jgi:hypothetical protein
MRRRWVGLLVWTPALAPALTSGGCLYDWPTPPLVGEACSPTRPCAPGLVCDYPDYQCGRGAAGACQLRSMATCPAAALVCTCEGKTIACAALGAGEPALATSCAAPANTRACGPLYCPKGNTACLQNTSPGASATGYMCEPQTCGDCSCARADCACSETADGPLVTCHFAGNDGGGPPMMMMPPPDGGGPPH